MDSTALFYPCLYNSTFRTLSQSIYFSTLNALAYATYHCYTISVRYVREKMHEERGF